MVSSVAVILGCLLVLTVLVDVFRTVLWSGQGAGPLTGAVTAVGRLLLAHLPGGARVRSAVGPAAIVAVVGLWSSLLLVGFTLVLEGDPDSIRTAATERPVDRSQRAYYVGYSLFTLGNGGLAPVTGFGRVVTVAVAAAGLFLITLSVTYLVPVISASVASRAFASSAMGLGERAGDVVLGAWDGERIRLEHQLREQATALSVLTQQQLAYPVLHLFQSSDPTASAPLAVERLDDVLTVLDGVDQRAAPPAIVRRQLRDAIQGYVRTSGHGTGAGTASAPPPPDIAELGARGVPVVDDAAYAVALTGLEDHRIGVRRLAAAARPDLR